MNDTKFWNSLVKKENGCWEFSGYITPDGYGRLRYGKEKILAHRLAFYLTYGQINPGMTIDHLCHNTKCCNPKHLEQVTPIENVLRGITNWAAVNKKKTHCPSGHEFSKYAWVDNRGSRHCRKCMTIRQREYRARSKK